jgi:hypothetical protein
VLYARGLRYRAISLPILVPDPNIHTDLDELTISVSLWIADVYHITDKYADPNIHTDLDELTISVSLWIADIHPVPNKLPDIHPVPNKLPDILSNVLFFAHNHDSSAIVRHGRS